MTAQRIVIPSTAFSKVPSKQRKPRERNEQHLKFIRTLKCCICGDPNPDPAHIRAASPLHGKRETGTRRRLPTSGARHSAALITTSSTRRLSARKVPAPS
jgi:hypothetical protein